MDGFVRANNFALAASSFQKVGGFDASFARAAAEDRDFCDRCVASGIRIVTAPDAVVWHYREMSLLGFCKHYFHYGQGAFVLADTRAWRDAGPVSFEGWSFHLGLLIAPMRKSLRLRSFYLSLLVIVEQFAYAMGYAYEARAHRHRVRRDAVMVK